MPDDWILGYALRGVNMDADELRELLDQGGRSSGEGGAAEIWTPTS